MGRALCAGLPIDWWTTGDDGNRLALAICRRCPNLDACPIGDPRPHGVIRAGAAYTDDGTRLPECRCGYPHVTYRGGPLHPCMRCRVPNIRIRKPGRPRKVVAV